MCIYKKKVEKIAIFREFVANMAPVPESKVSKKKTYD